MESFEDVIQEIMTKCCESTDGYETIAEFVTSVALDTQHEWLKEFRDNR